MTLINKTDNVSNIYPAQQMNDYMTALEARMDARFEQTGRNVDSITKGIRDTRESIAISQSAESPTAWQQIGDFFVRVCRFIGIMR